MLDQIQRSIDFCVRLDAAAIHRRQVFNQDDLKVKSNVAFDE